MKAMVMMFCSVVACATAALAADVRVNVAVEHDTWRVKEVGLTGSYFKGNPDQWFGAYSSAGTATVEQGKTITVEGVMGWRVQLVAGEDGKVKPGEIDKGKYLAEPPRVAQMRGTWVVFMPPMREVVIDVAPELGRYGIETQELQRCGRWVGPLPVGRFPVHGAAGWSCDLMVDAQGAKAENVAAGPYGELTVWSDKFAVSIRRPGLHEVIVRVRGEAEQWQVGAFARATGDGQVWLPEGDFKLEEQEIGTVPFTVTPQGLRSGDNGKAEVKGSQLHVTGRVIYRDSNREPTAYLFSRDRRTVFQQGEICEFSVVRKVGLWSSGKRLKLTVELQSEGTATTIARDEGYPLWSENYSLDTGVLRPGAYRLVASLEGVQAVALDLRIVEPEPDTHFKIVCYTGGHSVADLDKFSQGGINLQINNGCGPQMNRARLDRKFRKAYDDLVAAPTKPPIETVIGKPYFSEYLEQLLERRIELVAQFGAGHQFYHYGTCFTDPDLYKSVSRGTMAMCYAGRDFPNLVGVNLGDEMGTHRGVEHAEGCSFCRAAFQKKYGAPVPETQPEAPELWREWMDEKQDQFNVLMAYAGARVKRVSNVLLSSQHGGANFWPQDGGYPPRAMKEFDMTAAHWYGLDWAYGFNTPLWMATGKQFANMLPRKAAYWPFCYHDPGMEFSRHEVYQCVMFGCEGAGYFLAPWNKPGQWEHLSQVVHPRLHRFGDTLINLERDPSREVAILYSYAQHQADCWIRPNEVWVQSPARYLAPVLACYYSCLRAHVPASFVSEEQVMAGELDRRSVLILPALKSPEPAALELVRKFAARGGVVFVDKSATVQVPGAKTLPVDFETLYRRMYCLGEFAKAPREFWEPEVTKPMAAALREAVLPSVKLDADCDEQTVILNALVGGDARYVFALNDNFAGFKEVGEGEKKQKLAAFEPVTTTLRLSGAPGAVYDVWSGKRLEPDANGRLKLTIEGGDMAALALLPKPIGKLDLQANVAADGRTLRYSMHALDAEGNLLRSALPLEITVSDGQKPLRGTVWRSTAMGIFEGQVPLGFGDPAKVTVEVKSLLGGIAAKADVDVKTDFAALVKASVRELPDVIVDDAQHVRCFLRQTKHATIVIGEWEQMALAQRLKTALETRRGMGVDIAWDNQIAQNGFDWFKGTGVDRGRTGVNLAGPNIQIDRNLILLGSCETNTLVAALHLDSAWPRRMLTPDFPGSGRALIGHAFNAFSDEDCAVIWVAAGDLGGLERGVSMLADMSLPGGD